MNTLSFHLLRIGLAITFVWIGVFILQDLRGWELMIQPWALKLLSGSLAFAMVSTAILDIVVGLFLLLNIWTWFFAFVGALHLIIVFITVGINIITVRDIGLLFATAALMVGSLPTWIVRRF